MPTKFEFELKGVDRYLEALNTVFGTEYVVSVFTDAMNDARVEIEAHMEDELRKTSETWTGETAKTLFVSEVQQEGNFVYIELGADTSKDLAAILKEFGSARQAAEPFLRPTMRSHWLKNVLRNTMRAIFEKMAIDFRRL
jgi:hypothetical protein